MSRFVPSVPNAHTRQAHAPAQKRDAAPDANATETHESTRGCMSELEFLGALHVEMLRHGDLRPATRQHELFQTSTIDALLSGAFEGDVSLSELLQHGDLGLGTLNGLDGELIVIEGDAWQANAECKLIRATGSARTPYAVVTAFRRVRRSRSTAYCVTPISARRSGTASRT